MPLVSVIVPVYNVERYLARCLDSILAQTYRNLEIICINDGARDGSPAILTEYAAKDSRIKVLSQENKGLSAARNAGLDAMSGDYVLFVDSDDRLPVYAVERFVKIAIDSGASIVVSKSFLVDDMNGKPLKFQDSVGWVLRSPALEKLVGRRKIQSSACNKLYAASLLKTRRFIEGIYFEDWPFSTCLFGDVESFALANAQLYVYCKNGESIIRSAFTKKKAVSYLKGIAAVSEHFKGHPMRRHAMRRIAIAVKMLLRNATLSRDKVLRAMVRDGIADLVRRGALDRSSLDLRSRIRLWML